MQKPSILLVDDSEMMRNFLALFLSNKYQVTACATAEEAMNKVESGFRPALVLTDLDLPGMSGMELIRIFQLAMPFTPLIVVSGAKESNTRLEALATGADDLLSKPFHPAELAVRINKLLQRGELPHKTQVVSTNFQGLMQRAVTIVA